MLKSKFISRTEIPEVFILGFIQFITDAGGHISSTQTSFSRSKWESFVQSFGTLPSNYGSKGSDFILDTEFTDLKDGKPISIALVNIKNPESSFYVELNDTYNVDDCTEFVYKHVLPYLDGNACTSVEASQHILDFLHNYPQPWRLWSDCPPLDNVQINHILSPLAYESCSLRDIDYMLATCYVSYSRNAKEFDTYPLHNALSDAKRYAVTWNKISLGLDELSYTSDEPSLGGL